MTSPNDEPGRSPTSSDWERQIGSQRHDQYTPMGEIHMYGDFASGVRRARGWKLWLGLLLVLLILGPLLLGVVLMLNDLLQM